MKKISFSLGVLIFFSLFTSHIFGAEYGKATEKNSDFRFIVIGDSRPSRTNEPLPVAFSQILKEVSLINPDFVIHLGDFIWGYGDSANEIKKEFLGFKNLMDLQGFKYYLAPGNHDLPYRDALGIYRRILGPTYYSFAYSSTAFFVVNTDEWEPIAATLGSRQLDWLESETRKHKDANPKFLLLHRPPFVAHDFPYFFSVYKERGTELHKGEESRRLMKILRENGVNYVFCSHKHIYHYYDFDGIKQFISGGAGADTPNPEDGGFYNYLIVKVKGEIPEVKVIEPFHLGYSDSGTESFSAGKGVRFLQRRIFAHTFNLFHTPLAGVRFRVGGTQKSADFVPSSGTKIWDVKEDEILTSYTITTTGEIFIRLYELKPEEIKSHPIDLARYFTLNAFHRTGNPDERFDPAGSAYLWQRGDFKWKKDGDFINLYGVKFYPINPGGKNYVVSDAQEIKIPAGKYSAIALLGASAYGSHRSFADIIDAGGGRHKVEFRLTDWCHTPIFGELQAATFPACWVGRKKAVQEINNHIFLQIIPLPTNAGQIVAIRLPERKRIRLFAITMIK